LGIYIFSTNKLLKLDHVKSFRLAEENSPWMAILYEKYSEKEDTSKNDAFKTRSIKKKLKTKKRSDAAEFEIFNPLTLKKYSFKNITDYCFSKNGKTIVFTKYANDSVNQSTIYFFNTTNEKLDSLDMMQGQSKKIVCDNQGNQIAFIHAKDTSEFKIFSLYFVNINTKLPLCVVDTLTKEIPKKWTVSENSEIYFSKDDSKLYFGIALKPTQEVKDTLLDEERIKLDLWSWEDPSIQPQQLVELEKEKKRSYLTVYHIADKKIVQLATTEIPEVRTIMKGNSSIAIGVTDKPYLKNSNWESTKSKDIYTIDLKSGVRKLVLEKTQSSFALSPGGNYLIWYEIADSSWYSYSIANQSKTNLTKRVKVSFYDEDNDLPSDAEPYGFAGWTSNDENILIYDRYDIWKLDPNGKRSPYNLTQGYGRKNQIVYRYISLDDEAIYIPTSGNLLLKAFNKINKQSGFATITFTTSSEPKNIMMDNFKFSTPVKAKNENVLIWQKGSFRIYPDLWTSNLSFDNALKISDINPQQKNYFWGDVELVTWTNFEGEKVNGLLYKPENFDPNKKYPLIVYFYETYSDELNEHYFPKLSRSTINFTHYVSNNYLVFVPDIKYKIGYPGESAFTNIVSGALSLVSKGFVDKSNIGIQGQSWGGYQVAYLITRTNLFKSAMAGAPVSNMVSAYGGIRWESGLSRMFQYERTQSRIGGTLWQKPMNYIENSPIFFADKINTPLLIMSNDNDGSVPWYQGIELFMAMRRLNKPVWLLNYNGEPHNLRDKSPNSKDLTIRMMQYFDHYLKGKPAPKWLIEGIPAADKGKEFGYELMEK